LRGDILESLLAWSIEVEVLGGGIQEVHIFEGDLDEPFSSDESASREQVVRIPRVGIHEIVVGLVLVVDARIEDTPSTWRVGCRAEGGDEVLVAMVGHRCKRIVHPTQHAGVKEREGKVAFALVAIP